MPKKPTIKILVGYHKPSVLLKSNILTPIHLGRVLATQESKDGRMSSKDYQWMLGHMIGDDTGDNISHLNRQFCELTALYWAWKNYERMGDPDYIGFLHYRRQFIFNPYFDKKTYHYGQKPISKITPDYVTEHCMLDEDVLNAINGVDIVYVKPYVTEDSVIDNYARIIRIRPKVCTETFLKAIMIVKEMYPEYAIAAEDYAHGKENIWYQSFIMRKKIFFEYAEWLFPVLFQLDRGLDYSCDQQQLREIAYIGERLFGVFITKKGREYKTKRVHITLVSNTDREPALIRYKEKIKLYAGYIGAHLFYNRKRIEMMSKLITADKYIR